MRRILCGAAVALVAIGMAGAVEACSATDTISKARDVAGSDNRVYQAAKDAASSMIDQDASAHGNDWIKDEPTLDAGAGALLMDDSLVSGDRTVSSNWTAILDQETQEHGRSGGGSMIGAESGATIREHMRMHIYEIDCLLRGQNPTTGNPFIDALQAGSWETTRNYLNTVYGAGTAPGLGGGSSEPPPASEPPAPEPPVISEEPVPAPRPVVPPPMPEPILHHAG